jgi:hypothetical protein
MTGGCLFKNVAASLSSLHREEFFPLSPAQTVKIGISFNISYMKHTFMKNHVTAGSVTSFGGNFHMRCEQSEM